MSPIPSLPLLNPSPEKIVELASSDTLCLFQVVSSSSSKSPATFRGSRSPGGWLPKPGPRRTGRSGHRTSLRPQPPKTFSCIKGSRFPFWEGGGGGGGGAWGWKFRPKPPKPILIPSCSLDHVALQESSAGCCGDLRVNGVWQQLRVWSCSVFWCERWLIWAEGLGLLTIFTSCYESSC